MNCKLVELGSAPVKNQYSQANTAPVSCPRNNNDSNTNKRVPINNNNTFWSAMALAV